jgi:CarD family transcriptional regulator
MSSPKKSNKIVAKQASAAKVVSKAPGAKADVKDRSAAKSSSFSKPEGKSSSKSSSTSSSISSNKSAKKPEGKSAKSQIKGASDLGKEASRIKSTPDTKVAPSSKSAAGSKSATQSLKPAVSSAGKTTKIVSKGQETPSSNTKTSRTTPAVKPAGAKGTSVGSVVKGPIQGTKPAGNASVRSNVKKPSSASPAKTTGAHAGSGSKPSSSEAGAAKVRTGATSATANTSNAASKKNIVTSKTAQAAASPSKAKTVSKSVAPAPAKEATKHDSMKKEPAKKDTVNAVAESTTVSKSVEKSPSKIASKPSASAPVADKPVAAPKSVAAKPVAPKPVATKPVEAKPEAVKPDVTVSTPVEKPAPVAASVAAPAPAAARPVARPQTASRPVVDVKPAKVAVQHGFKALDYIVYPAHGVGQISSIEQQEVAGFKLELFVIDFVKDKMTLKVPLPKVLAGAIRKLSTNDQVTKALGTLTGRARIKRTMWSRRAQEYEAKINSGDLVSIAEVTRDLFRPEDQPEQSYSERQIFEAALDRMAREVAAVQKLTESESLKLLESYLQRGPKRGARGESEEAANGDAGDIEEAA